MSKDEALNIASQCRATASHDLACNIVVDAGSGLLRELLIDAAMVIEALAPTSTQCEIQPEHQPVYKPENLTPMRPGADDHLKFKSRGF